MPHPQRQVAIPFSTELGRDTSRGGPDIGDAIHVVVRGELDIAAVPQLDIALRRAQAVADAVVLDLRELQFIDSSGAQLILAADRRIRWSGGRLIVVRGPAEIDWFLALVGMDELLELVDRTNADAQATLVVNAGHAAGLD
ncbi:MAG: STAS domain-containing protein [Actinomycetota bacterium]|nr:STAS domain-containing protein [Actinomycetota bacterium]